MKRTDRNAFFFSDLLFLLGTKIITKGGDPKDDSRYEQRENHAMT